mgnify:CR=1 FL=1
MTKAQELAEMINGREYWDETTDEMVQFAKENNLMICTGYSDDNITLYWAFEEEVWLSSSKAFQVFKRGDRYQWIIRADKMEERADKMEDIHYDIEDAILADIACEAIEDFLDKKALYIRVKYNNEWDWYLFDMSCNSYPTFEIMEDWEPYCIGCVVDLSSLEEKTYWRDNLTIWERVYCNHIWDWWILILVENWLATFRRSDWTFNSIWVNHLVRLVDENE